MLTWKDVTTIGLALPKTHVSTWYGTPGMKVAGKGFLRLRMEAEGGLVVLCDPTKKAVLLRSGDPAFYTTPHYDGYPAILVNLKKVKRAEEPRTRRIGCEAARRETERNPGSGSADARRGRHGRRVGPRQEPGERGADIGHAGRCGEPDCERPICEPVRR